MPPVRQNERDYKSLGDAVTSGRITAEPGMSAVVDAGRLCPLRLTICPDGRITYPYPPSSFLPWPAA
jgi:hypothetical protein